MRQTRLSIGCQDWQRIVGSIGADAAALYLYLRTVMRSTQTGEIRVTLPEIETATKLPSDRAKAALSAICSGYMTRTDNADGTMTLTCPDEKRALAEAARKRSARALARSKKICGQSEYIFFVQNGPSAERPASYADAGGEKEYTSEVMMVYDPTTGGNSGHTLFDKNGNSGQAEKEPHTPQKEESLTEIQTHTRSKKTYDTSLPVDQLEADYIDVCGSWPDSLRKAVRSEAEDVREAFYLCIRKRQTDEGHAWSADQVRMALLAARRIPQERRAESILAWGMGNWKTIRDAGSGCYFEKSTGRVVSLVRGTIEPKGAQVDPANATLAEKLARNMRRA